VSNEVTPVTQPLAPLGHNISPPDLTVFPLTHDDQSTLIPNGPQGGTRLTQRAGTSEKVKTFRGFDHLGFCERWSLPLNDLETLS